MASFIDNIRQRLQSLKYKKGKDCATAYTQVKTAKDIDCVDHVAESKHLGPKSQSVAPNTIKLDEKQTKLNLSGKGVISADVLEEVLRQHSEPSRVITFRLTDNEGLTRIPTTIARYDQLKELDLSNNYIMEIHWSIVYLKQLEILNLARNAISIIPKMIGHVGNLLELDISENPITNLPTELLYLRRLKELNVSGCKYLISPALEECKDLPQIFELLGKRQDRQNVWEGGVAWYSQGSIASSRPCWSVKSLQSCCIDVIVSNKIDFIYSQFVPPVMKNDLQTVENESHNRLKVSKCSRCNGYFSSMEIFDAHVCKV